MSLAQILETAAETAELGQDDMAHLQGLFDLQRDLHLEATVERSQVNN